MFEVRMTTKAVKQLHAIPFPLQSEIGRFLKELTHYPNTRHLSIKKLHGESGYRARVGNYRIIFIIDGKKHIVFVTRIKDRKDVYR